MVYECPMRTLGSTCNNITDGSDLVETVSLFAMPAIPSRHPQSRLAVYGPHQTLTRSGGGYAASFGIALSTNRKNRALRAPATNDPSDSDFSESPVPFRKDRVLRLRDLNVRNLGRTES
jgi:hypothetical protein